MQTRLLRPVVLALVVAAPLALAQKTKDGKYSHPNLMAAEKLVAQAHGKLEAAQVANEYDLGGHAQKAKELLKQAQEELKLATAAAAKK